VVAVVEVGADAGAIVAGRAELDGAAGELLGAVEPIGDYCGDAREGSTGGAPVFANSRAAFTSPRLLE